MNVALTLEAFSKIKFLLINHTFFSFFRLYLTMSTETNILSDKRVQMSIYKGQPLELYFIFANLEIKIFFFFFFTFAPFVVVFHHVKDEVRTYFL